MMRRAIFGKVHGHGVKEIWLISQFPAKHTGVASVFARPGLAKLLGCGHGVINNEMIIYIQGFWYFAEKKAKYRGIFRGKFAEKSTDFAGFSREKSQNLRNNRPISREKSQNSQKNRPISEDFSGKKVNFRRIFRGKFLEKSADFTGNFEGKLRQETIRKKQPISLDFFSVNFAKIDQFCVDMTSVGKLFF